MYIVPSPFSSFFSKPDTEPEWNNKTTGGGGDYTVQTIPIDLFLDLFRESPAA